MNTTLSIRSLKTSTVAGFVGIMSLSFALPTVTPRTGSAEEAVRPACVINYIGHETTPERTRVILHANTTIDYRGGSLRGNQVVLDLANTQVSLPSTVVEVGAPEVDRVVIGPEITKDNDKLLKVRLLGVKASSHKVETKGNELFVDLKPLKGARDGQKGMPKIINNSSETTASMRGSNPPVIKWAKAVPVTTDAPADEPDAAPVSAPKPHRVKMVAIQAGEDLVADLEPAPAAPAPVEMAVQVEPPAAAPAAPAAMPAPASVLSMAASSSDNADARVLKVSVGRSLTLDTGVPVSRVSVSNPAVAEPIAISPTQMLINGLAPGVVSLVLWPKQGPAIVYELVVAIDTMGLSHQIETIFPKEKVRVQSSKDSIVLSGAVSEPAVAEKMVKLASDYSSKIVNDMTFPGTKRKQVLLKVKFAEVSKQAMTELATMWTHVDPTNPLGHDRGNAGTGQSTPPFGNVLNEPQGPDITWSDAINLSYFDKRIDLGLFITALKTRGLFQELAEPTLIAASGQEANFLAGGEFPVPIAQPGANFVAVTVEWKKFGIMLDFKPTIVDDVIVMKVKPEVSSLDFSTGVSVQGFRIPSLIVRRAETEVELRSGQSFAIAGLYDKTLLQTKQRIPILGDIPILGYLFRSKALQKNQAELLVIVTPTIVEPLGSEAAQPSLVMPESFDIDKPAKK